MTFGNSHKTRLLFVQVRSIRTVSRKKNVEFTKVVEQSSELLVEGMMNRYIL